jgi:hypothetical protein
VNPALHSTYNVSASGGSGTSINFSIAPRTTNHSCSLTGPATVTFDHAGTCVVAADVTSKAAAHAATQTIHVHRSGQTITFTSSPPADAAFNDTSRNTYHLTATGGGSGNPVTFSVSATNGACVLNGSTVTFQHAGSCVIRAHQAGDADYKDAPSVTQTVVVPKAAQALVFNPALPSSATVGDKLSFVVTGGDSGQPVTVTSSSGACSVSGSFTVSFDAVGTCTLTAAQDGNADYDPAPTLTESVDVSPQTDLQVTAKVVPLTNGNQQEVDVTVSGLPANGHATLTTTGPDDLHSLANGTKCPCNIQGPSQTIAFVYNSQQSPVANLTFTVSTNDSPDPDKTNDSVSLQIDNTSPSRSFRMRTQSGG